MTFITQLSLPSYQSSQSHLILVKVLILIATYLLSACDDNNHPNATAISSTHSVSYDGTPITNQTYCHKQHEPFVYSLCQVNQSVLIEDATARNEDTNDTSGNAKHFVSPAGLSLRLFWKADDDNQNQSRKPLYTFNALLENLPQNTQLQFATNAGMYDTQFAPIGYTVMQGKQIRSLNLKEGGGNFHLLPNGVLWWDKSGTVHITESQKMAKLLDSGQAQPWYATQSGPMLVIDGEIHPKFDKNSQSVKFRNGVGICKDDNIVFINSHVPVTFYQFASLFKEQLQCDNALFLDGGIASALYAPEINEADKKNMGVIIGLVSKSNLI